MKSINIIFSLLLLLLPALITSSLVRLPLKKARKIKPTTQDSILPSQNQNGSIAIRNDEGLGYLAVVAIGSQGQEFELQIDTGSGDLWVPDVSLSSELPGTPTYDCAASTTCTAYPEDAQTLEYGSGDIELFKITDQVSIGGLVIPSFDMNLATNLGTISLDGMDGILGLSLGRDTDNNPTVLETLKANNLISVGTFSLFVSTDQDSDEYNNIIGELIFGGYDPKYAQGDFQFVNVLPVDASNPDPYWQAPMTAVGFGARNLSAFTPSNTVFDSGTTFILLPQLVLNQILDEASSRGVEILDYDGQYQCLCSAKDQLPDLTFHFEGAAFSIPASSYIIDPDYLDDSCVVALSAGVASTDFTVESVVLGDVFLKNFYGLYTADNSTIGFAKSVLSTKGTKIEAESPSEPEPASASIIEGSNETSDASRFGWFMSLLVLIVLVL